MEKLHYGRVAATGWLFVLVLIASLGASESPAWGQIWDLLLSEKSTVALAVATAVAGLGGPPALGILLDRLAALILVFAKANMWYLPFNKQFGDLLRSVDLLEDEVNPSGAFHIFFYTHADSRLIDWMRRRTTQVYGSVTAAMAMILSLLSAWSIGAFSAAVAIGCLLIVVALVAYSILITKAISDAGQAWVSTIGKAVIYEYSQGVGADSRAKSNLPLPNHAAASNSA